MFISHRLRASPLPCLLLCAALAAGSPSTWARPEPSAGAPAGPAPKQELAEKVAWSRADPPRNALHGEASPVDPPPEGAALDGPPPRPRLRPPSPPPADELDALSGNPFRPLPQDLRPLGPDEDRALLRFAERSLPQIAEPLARLHTRNPREFRRRLQEVAPRLRMLRRLMDEDPEIGQALVRHTTNLDWIKRVPRVLDEIGREPADREWLMHRVRQKMRENVEIETRVVKAQAEKLERDAPRIIERQLERMYAADSDLRNQPPPALDSIARYWATSDPDERARIEDESRQRLTQRLQERARDVRTHLKRLEQQADREVEQRFEHWRSQLDSAAGPGPDGVRQTPLEGGPPVGPPPGAPPHRKAPGERPGAQPPP